MCIYFWGSASKVFFRHVICIKCFILQAWKSMYNMCFYVQALKGGCNDHIFCGANSNACHITFATYHLYLWLSLTGWLVPSWGHSRHIISVFIDIATCSNKSTVGEWDFFCIFTIFHWFLYKVRKRKKHRLENRET